MLPTCADPSNIGARILKAILLDVVKDCPRPFVILRALKTQSLGRVDLPPQNLSRYLEFPDLSSFSHVQSIGAMELSHLQGPVPPQPQGGSSKSQWLSLWKLQVDRIWGANEAVETLILSNPLEKQ